MTAPAPEVQSYVAQPTAGELLSAFLGWPAPDADQEVSAEAHLSRAVSLVRSYTRGKGFIGDLMAPPLAQVVPSAAARSLNNPTSDARVTAGTYSASPGQPDWTLTERLTLDGYRRRAA
jgi:hypothetical protein